MKLGQKPYWPRTACNVLMKSCCANVVFKFNAEPPIVVNVTLTPLSNAHENANFTVTWSQSNCTVQYVVTIINSSDDRVYPNITTSNTNTTVTLPTGVEFCVTLVAVDSIGRRGPNTTPVCNG